MRSYGWTWTIDETFFGYQITAANAGKTVLFRFAAHAVRSGMAEFVKHQSMSVPTIEEVQESIEFLRYSRHG